MVSAARLAYPTAPLEQFTHDPPVAPSRVLFGHADNRGSYVWSNRPGATNTARLFACLLLLDLTDISAALHDADDAFGLLIELGSDLHKPRSFFRREDQSLLIQLST